MLGWTLNNASTRRELTSVRPPSLPSIFMCDLPPAVLCYLSVKKLSVFSFTVFVDLARTTPLNSAPTVCGDTATFGPSLESRIHFVGGGEQNEFIEVGPDGTFLRAILKKLYQKLCWINLERAC